jgi:hypothetical protein
MSEVENAMVCPRRSESGAMFRLPKNDEWRIEPGGGRTCSYCGSIHPDEFFAAVAAGARIGPTDKDYKAYVDLPDARAGEPCVLSSANFKQEAAGWTEVTAENIGTLPLDDYQRTNYLGHWVKVEPRPALRHAKFYFQHLSEADQQRFIDHLNAKTMNIGMPGYFYSRPFFIAPPESAA